MNTSLPSNKPLILSVLFHIVLVGLLIGFETTETIYVSPPADETPIIEASVVFNRAVSKPLPKPEPKIIPKPEIKPEPEPEPEPERITQNIVAIKAEVKPPKPDKKREKELKKMAERSLEQAFQQENLEKNLQDDLQKKLKEHDIELKQSAAASQSDVNQHMSLIAAKVNRNWRKPLDTNTAGLNCLVLIKVLPNGEISDVKVIQGSGDLGFDRSAEIAVRKSSPLPTPKNELVRAEFKNFEFVFKPGGG